MAVSTRDVVATGCSCDSTTVSLRESTVGTVDHYVIAARGVGDNLHAKRVRVEPSLTSASLSAADLGIEGGSALFVSGAAADAAGHESLFAYPEYRCDSASCVVPPGSLDVTARN